MRSSTTAAIRALEGDLTSTLPLFDDDAAFIQEVLDGRQLAPNMKLQTELDG